jgi:RNA polymerase sigma-70 factor (ECF subfamily)
MYNTLHFDCCLYNKAKKKQFTMQFDTVILNEMIAEVEIKESFTPKARRDCILVKQALEEGDQYAYAQLLENYRESLYMLMLKMSNNPYDAEDLTIEAFGKAFKHLSQYTFEYAFSTWLFKIAANNCLNFLRKRSHSVSSTATSLYNSETAEFTDMDFNDNSLNPEETFFFKEQSQILRFIVSKLKPHYRQLVELRYFQELSYEEIAVFLDIPLGSVKAKLFRAKEILQKIIRKDNLI